MARKKRSGKELAAAADRLHREVRAFTLLVNALIAPPRPLPPVARDAVRDAFVDHARRLAHFLHPLRPQPGDVLAADFFPTAARWNKLRLPASEQLQAVRATGREACMAYGAADPPPPPEGRQVLEIANEISAGISIFLRHAPREALGDRWQGVRPEP
jgi:hypothetical protein